MNMKERIVNALMRGIFRLLFTMDLSEFEKVPRQGPFIIIANHTSALDGPLMYVFMRPRNMIAMGKKELWDHWLTRFIMNLWNTIPVDRGNMGRDTMQQCFSVLDRKDILAIAPEGTRNTTGELQEGKDQQLLSEQSGRRMSLSGSSVLPQIRTYRSVCGSSSVYALSGI
jgi:1-acyl-sn-glycerol-3-phosphate acyltransferase